MSYVSKAEKERAKWMPISEAVRHIRNVDRCTRTKAVKQLFAALREKAIDCKWADMKPPPWGPASQVIFPTDSLPNPSAWRAPKFIMKGGGLVKFDPAEPPRPLLLRREHVSNIWPYPAASAEHAVDVNADWDKVVKLRTVSLDDLRQWYIARVKEFESRDRPPSREYDERAAREHFTGLRVPREWLRQLRKELAPTAWHREGPKPRA